MSGLSKQIAHTKRCGTTWRRTTSESGSSSTLKRSWEPTTHSKMQPMTPFGDSVVTYTYLIKRVGAGPTRLSSSILYGHVSAIG